MGNAEYMGENALRDVIKIEQTLKEEREARKSIEQKFQDAFSRQGATQTSTIKKLVHKPECVPCNNISGARAEGSICICNVESHWHFEDAKEVILIGTTELETEEIIDKEDLLGGRYDDVPREVHERMVKLAVKGNIPITTLAQRRFLARKRRTYHGDAKWKLPVKYGYLHLALRPPTGFFWHKSMWSCTLVPTPQQ